MESKAPMVSIVKAGPAIHKAFPPMGSGLEAFSWFSPLAKWSRAKAPAPIPMMPTSAIGAAGMLAQTSIVFLFRAILSCVKAMRHASPGAQYSRPGPRIHKLDAR